MIRAEQVWQEYHPRLRAFIRRRVADEAAADDILQDVFLKMHSGLPSLKEAARLQSWLYQITRNALIDVYRRQQPTVAVPEWLAQAEADPDDQVRQDLADCLLPMIEQLPPIYREAIVLSELNGMKQQEVAALQKTSLSGAKSRVQRGRALLKTKLEDCCRLEFDHKGRIVDYEPRNGSCHQCG
jgi:RNA polymerase sigma-70 factor (ECF subfamily)